MSDRKSLLLFAFVSKEFEASGDLVTGLLPLFAPIAARNPGTPFSAEAFCESVKVEYGMVIHPYVAEFIAEKLFASGLLGKTTGKGGKETYIHKLPAADAGSITPILEGDVARLVSTFVRFARDAIGTTNIALSDEELDAGFVERLRRADFVSIAQRPEKYRDARTLALKKSPRQSHAPDKSTILDYLVASFVLDVQKSNQPLYELAVAIASGALVAEVVETLREPPAAAAGDGDLTVVVDGPLLMDALGLSDDQRQAYAKSLFQAVKDAKLQLVTFPHVLDELRRAARNTYELWRTTTNAYGPLAHRLRTRRAMGPYVVALLANLPERIAELGVTVIEPTAGSIIDGYKYFLEKDEKLLNQNIGAYNYAVTAERDAKSIATVIRLRGGLPSKSLMRSKFVFVTRNARLARLSQQFLEEHSYPIAEGAPPCVSDRHFAGVMWIAYGGLASGLPEKKLLANCAAAIQPRQDVIARMVDLLQESGPEEVRVFQALMSSDRAAHVLMQRSMGEWNLVDRDNHREILEDVRRAIAEEIAFEKNAEIAEMGAKLRASNEKATADKKAADDRVKTLSGALEAMQQKAIQEEMHRRELEERVNEMARVEARRVERGLSQIAAKVDRELLYIKILTVLLGALIAVGASFLVTQYVGSFVAIVALAGAAAIYQIANKLFHFEEAVLQGAAFRFFAWRGEVLAHQRGFDFEWSTVTIRCTKTTVSIETEGGRVLYPLVLER